MTDFDMEELDSQSIITPPGSPILGYTRSRLLEDARLALTTLDDDISGPERLFNCKGPIIYSDKTFSSEGLFRRGEISLSIDIVKSTTSIDNRLLAGTHKFFGFDFDLTEEDGVIALISAVRKRVTSVEILTRHQTSNGLQQYTNGSTDSDTGFAQRLEIARFSNFLVQNRGIFTPFDSIFNGLILTLSSVKDWPPCLQDHNGSPNGNECTSAEFHLFHTHLELRWRLLVYFKLRTDILHWVIDDLIYLAFLKFKTSHSSNTKTSFNCYCVLEFWAMLRLLVEELIPDGKTFADLVKLRIRQIQVDATDLFPVWLTLSLSQLTAYEATGEWNPLRKPTTETERLELYEILKQWLIANRNASPTTLIRVHSLIRDFLPQFGSDLTCIMMLWLYWLPRLDKGYEARNMDHYSTSTKWLRLITRICATSNTNAEMDPDSLSSEPFVTFLILLVEIINQCTVKDWKKLRAGICNRLTAKVVEGFGENGLTRITTLILCMAFIAKTDVIELCQQLNNLLNFGKESLRRVTFRGRSAMILLLLHKGLPVGACSAPLMKIVDEIMGTLHRNPAERDTAMAYWDLIQNLPTVSPHSDLEQSKLISINLTPWLSTCGQNCLVRTLRILHSLFHFWILNTNTVPTMEKSEIARLVVERADTFLQQYIMTEMESIDVEPFADLAVDFTVFQKLNRNYTGASRLFQLFALCAQAAPKVSEVYLDRLIGHTEFGEWDNSFVSEIQLSQSWIRLVVLGVSVPVQLTAKILNPHTTEKPMEVISSSLNSDTLLRRFCDFVNSRDCNWTKSKLADIWRPIDEAIKIAVTIPTAITTKCYDADTVESVINSAVSVLQRAQLDKIYAKNTPSSLVIQILEAVVPHFLGKPPWEKLPPIVVQTLRKCLDKIFIFINSADWVHDPFLKRKLSDAFRFAFLGFITTGDLDDANPGLLIMRHIEDLKPIPEQLLSELLGSLQQLTKEDKFMKRFLLAYLGFLKQRMVLTTTWLFGLVLELMVEKDSEVVAKCNGLLLNCVVLALSSRSRDGTTTSSQTTTNRLAVAFETTMTKHFSFRSKRFFDFFNTLVSHGTKRPVVLQQSFLSNQIIPMLRNQIQLSERKQGGGTNSALRNQLSLLEANLIKATQIMKF